MKSLLLAIPAVIAFSAWGLIPKKSQTAQQEAPPIPPAVEPAPSASVSGSTPFFDPDRIPGMADEGKARAASDAAFRKMAAEAAAERTAARMAEAAEARARFQAAVDADWKSVLAAHPEAAHAESELSREIAAALDALPDDDPVWKTPKVMSHCLSIALETMEAQARLRIANGTPRSHAEWKAVEARRQALRGTVAPRPAVPEVSNREILDELKDLRAEQAGRDAALREEMAASEQRRRVMEMLDESRRRSDEWHRRR